MRSPADTAPAPRPAGRPVRRAPQSPASADEALIEQAPSDARDSSGSRKRVRSDSGPSWGSFAKNVTRSELLAAFGDDTTAVLVYDTATIPVSSAPGAEYLQVSAGGSRPCGSSSTGHLSKSPANGALEPWPPTHSDKPRGASHAASRGYDDQRPRLGESACHDGGSSRRTHRTRTAPFRHAIHRQRPADSTGHGPTTKPSGANRRLRVSSAVNNSSPRRSANAT